MLQRLFSVRLLALLLIAGLAFEAAAQGPPPPGVRRPTPSVTPPPVAAPPVTFEAGIDRPGGDYSNFELAAPDAGLCASACSADRQCAAWTYVQPGVQGTPAHCWLKSVSAPPQPNGCCISGVTRAPAGIRIDNPTVDGLALDYCKTWSVDCGPPAADAWCQSKGYRAAVDFTLALGRPPTKIIGDGQVCNESFCGAIVSVICSQ